MNMRKSKQAAPPLPSDVTSASGADANSSVTMAPVTAIPNEQHAQDADFEVIGTAIVSAQID